MASSRLNRCESCDSEMSPCTTNYCQGCDKTFDKQFGVEDLLRCPQCQSCADGTVVKLPDVTLCKGCLSTALTESPSLPNTDLHTKEDCKSTRLDAQAMRRSESAPGPRDTTEDSTSEYSSLIACCHRCNIKYAAIDEVASCSECGREADSFEEMTASLPVPSASCSRDTSDTTDSAAKGAELDAQPAWMQHHEDELWRFVGCICQNIEPFLFDLQKAKSSKKSFYCMNCPQPYGMYAFKQELSGDSCPKCHSGRVEADDIPAGEEIIVCLYCDGEVSKRRIDQHCSNVEHDVQRQLDEHHLKQFGTDCQSCGKKTEVGFTERNGNVWLVQNCIACGKYVPIHDIETAQKPPEQVPDGFEELARHCCGLVELHPVDGDTDDNLLECSCGNESRGPICLTACRNPKIPKTVTELRRTLKGTYSSGEMGLPFQTVKLRSAADLKPADHLDFDRGLYSHHAIVVEVNKSRQEVALIEYTGEVDARTAKAVLTSSTKGRVEHTLHSFETMEKDGRVVQYHSLDCFRPSVVLKRAFKRLDEKQYHVGQKNCEHFCLWAKTGLDISRQVDQFKENAKKVLSNPIVENILKGIRLLGFSKTSVGIAVGAIDELRSELIELFSIKKGAWDKILRMAVRLGLKWGIRGLPFLIAILCRQERLLTYLPHVDSYLVKPFAENVVNYVAPLKDKDCDKD